MGLKSKENSLGAWAFLMGVILALVIGISTSLFPVPSFNMSSSGIYAILVMLGIVVGSMNVTGKDSQTFLIAGTVLVIVSGFGIDAVSSSLIGAPIVDGVKTVFAALMTLFVPATIIVALKTVFSIAKV